MKQTLTTIDQSEAAYLCLELQIFRAIKNLLDAPEHEQEIRVRDLLDFEEDMKATGLAPLFYEILEEEGVPISLLKLSRRGDA